MFPEVLLPFAETAAVVPAGLDGAGDAVSFGLIDSGLLVELDPEPLDELPFELVRARTVRFVSTEP